jgi:glutathione S-transferase
VFGAFVSYLKSAEGAAGEEKRAELHSALVQLNGYLLCNGPFLGGEKVCAADLGLAPKLHHMQVALAHYKNGWCLTEEMGAVEAYMGAITARASWKATAYTNEIVIQGWGKHVSAGL